MDQMRKLSGYDEVLEQKKLEYKIALGELFALCRSAADLSQFLQSFLLAAARVTDGQGGCLWVRRGEALALAFDTGDARMFVPATEGGGGDDEIVERVSQVLNPYVAPLTYRGGGEERHGFIGIYVPVEKDDGLFGILKVVKEQASKVIYKEEVELLQHMTGLIPFYLNQLQMPKLRGRMEELAKLFDIDREIFSSLEPAKIAFVVANLLPEVVPCQRCTVALFGAEKLKIEAITGLDVIEQKSAVIRSLTRVIAATAEQNEPLSITQDGLEAMEEGELKEAGHEYLEEHPFRILHMTPIETKGRKLGMIGIESAKEENFSPTDLMFLKFVATQAALALENAHLFQGIPLAATSQKVRAVSQRFGLMSRVKRAAIVAILLLVFVGPFVIPLENKVSGKCTIQPMHRYFARSKSDGILKSFLVQEGKKVAQGSVVALLDDEPYRKRLAEALSRRDVLNADTIRNFGLKQYADYEISRLKLKEVEAEVAFLNAELEKTRILAEGAGTVVTPQPRFLERVGKAVAKGEELIEIGELDRLKLEVAVPEQEIKFVRVGQEIRFLLNSLPERSFDVKIDKIREKAETTGTQNSFIVEAALHDVKGPFKPGMEGMARIYTGKQSLGRVFFGDMIDWFTMFFFKWF